MSFFFRGGSRQRPTPQEIVRSIKDSLVALDTKTGAKVLYGGRPSLPRRLGVRMHFPSAPRPICACVLAAGAALLEVDLLCLESCTGSLDLS
jgi:hypothetical protein